MWLFGYSVEAKGIKKNKTPSRGNEGGRGGWLADWRDNSPLYPLLNGPRRVLLGDATVSGPNALHKQHPSRFPLNQPQSSW